MHSGSWNYLPGFHRPPSTVAAHMRNMHTPTRAKDVQGTPVNGGQFAAPAHATDESVMLGGRQPHEMDQLGLDAFQRLAVYEANWQHGVHEVNTSLLSPWNPMSLEDYAEDIKKAESIYELAEGERNALIQRLKLTRHKHLLEPGQQIGNEAVTVPDRDYRDEEVLTVLATQDDFKLLDLDKPAVLTKIKGTTAHYRIERRGVTQNVTTVAETNFLYFQAGVGNDVESSLWGFDASMQGSSTYEDATMNDRFAPAANFHLGKCLMADEAGKNERLKPHYNDFKKFDLKKRRVTVKADEEEIILDFSGPDMKVMDSNLNPIPAMAADGFAKQFAKSIRYQRGAGPMRKDLAAVFDNAAKRLAG